MKRSIIWRVGLITWAALGVLQTATAAGSANTKPETEYAQQLDRPAPWEKIDPSQPPESLNGWDQERDGTINLNRVDRANAATLRDLFDSLLADSEFADYLADVEAYQDRIDIIDTRTNEFEDLEYNWVASDKKEYGEWRLISSSGGQAKWTPPIRGTENFSFVQKNVAKDVYERTVTEFEQNIVNPDKVRPGKIYTVTKEEEVGDGRERMVNVKITSENRCSNYWKPYTSSVWYGEQFTQERVCTTITTRRYTSTPIPTPPSLEEYVASGKCMNIEYYTKYNWTTQQYEKATGSYSSSDHEEYKKGGDALMYWDPNYLNARNEACKGKLEDEYGKVDEPVLVPRDELLMDGNLVPQYFDTDTVKRISNRWTETRPATGTRGIYRMAKIIAKNKPDGYTPAKGGCGIFGCPAEPDPKTYAGKECPVVGEGIIWGWQPGIFGLPSYAIDPNAVVDIAHCKPR